MTIELEGKMYSSPPLIDGNEINTEWKLFKRALARETKAVIEREKLIDFNDILEVFKDYLCYYNNYYVSVSV